ncbi:quinone oxidoreductase family protein [Kitasatospora viridis]|uniref:NADPH:quinone reductase-like Zn-dependent oxidoreductase n=1 Tax=Kitasatospora viridis TaxID=281105 RepID=A0A561UAF3_9ACTN|nr:zinc-binding dehydrogenase [Kitasatospora viridis]TWF96350.1 NADPH:quinone reductase-like Zn-dependent oxidoreductase [Kitasatospora viridis]
MRKIRFHRDSDTAAALVLDEQPVPSPASGEVQVRAEVAGVTLMLLKQFHAPDPQVGGSFVGRITAVGSGVTGHQVGQRVGGVAADTFADVLTAHPATITPVPEEADAAEALGLVHGGLVALSALKVGQLDVGATVLITNAAGGVGHLLVQLAKALGAGRVVAAVSDPAAKADFLRGLGADEVVGYQEQAGPVDLVLEGAGGAVLPWALGTLRPFGRLVTLAGYGGTLDAGAVLGSMATVTGLSMGQLARHRPELLAEVRAELWELLAAGRVKPVSEEFPLERAAEAVARLEHRANLGRVVLRIG